jgi:CO dehydrogenase maturation factor
LKIAISGKGGVGKTAICSNIAKLYVKKGFNVYAVDADPSSGLGQALGLTPEKLESVKPIIDMREFIDDKAGDGALYLLNPDVDGVADKFSLLINGVRFLRMAGIKTGGSSCYCREHSFLKAIVNSLSLDEYDVALLDMSAGIEHLTRGTAQGVDVMLIVTEAGRGSAAAARNIEKLSAQLGIKKIKFIGNKVKSEKEELFIKANFSKNELAGVIHYSEWIADREMGIAESGSRPINPEIEAVLDKIIARLSL